MRAVVDLARFFRPLQRQPSTSATGTGVDLRGTLLRADRANSNTAFLFANRVPTFDNAKWSAYRTRQRWSACANATNLIASNNIITQHRPHCVLEFFFTRSELLDVLKNDRAKLFPRRSEVVGDVRDGRAKIGSDG